MRVLIFLVCLTVPIFCNYEYRNEYYDSPYSRIQEHRGQQQTNDLYDGRSTNDLYDGRSTNDLYDGRSTNDLYDGRSQFQQNRGQQQLSDYGYDNSRLYENRGQQQFKTSAYDEFSNSDIANVLHLVKTVTNQMNAVALRTGDPIDFKMVASNDPKHVALELEGHIPEKTGSYLVRGNSAASISFGAVLANRNSLRQNFPLSDSGTTLSQAGISDILLPGAGPSIKLSVEGKLADMIKDMKIFDLQVPDDMKRDMLSGAYQARLKSMLSTGREYF